MVSVIVPCYNYAHYLGEALDSVLAQMYSDWECIIVNDGSPDNTEEVALKYCNKDRRFKYLYKENGGHSSARNFGIRNSSGQYILPLDADDIISDCYIDKAVEILEKDNNVKVVAGQIQFFGTEDEKQILPSYDFRSLLLMSFISVSCVYRREDYDRTNGYDETMLGFEDWDFWINVLKDGGEVIELPQICLYYRKKEKSVFKDVLKDKKRIFKDLLKLYNNHAESYEKYFSSPIELIQQNEKMQRIIKGYHESPTYRAGLKFNKVRGIFKLFK